MLSRESLFIEFFPLGTVYDNKDRQKEGFTDSSALGRFNPVQIHHLMMSLLQKDVLDQGSKEEQSVTQLQKYHLLQTLQSQSIEQMPAHVKAM
jgi:hypothetical protein